MSKVKLIGAVIALALVIWFGSQLGAMVDKAEAQCRETGGVARYAK